jgi:hypothetical protein
MYGIMEASRPFGVAEEMDLRARRRRTREVGRTCRVAATISSTSITLSPSRDDGDRIAGSLCRASPREERDAPFPEELQEAPEVEGADVTAEAAGFLDQGDVVVAML